MSSVDLDAYFERVAWGNGTQPTFETLCGILGAHMARIPFENLDVLLGLTPRLDLEGLQEKLVRDRRGGYCFEHITLLASVLQQLDFEVHIHTARVVLVWPPDRAPRSHGLIRVRLSSGEFLLDPGFGALAPRVPLPLNGTEARHDGERHWLGREGRRLILRTEVDGKPVDAWVTTLDEDNPVDLEVGNHYTATHPSSPFRSRLMGRALIPGGRVTLMNRDAKIARAGETKAFQLADRRALRGLFAEHFGFDLPELEKLRLPSVPEWS
jgi:N-hydroxyarylamine O-acetyltransferase